jgi:hypothetical protein
MRLPAKLLLTGAALLVSASCVGDNSVAPKGAPTIGGNPALRALVVAQSVDLVIPAAGGQLNILNVYTLSFPAGAVCDPNATDTQVGYANAQWDAPCTPATTDIPIRATVKYSGDRLYVDFQPALRFVPNKNVSLSTSILAPVVQYFDGSGVTSGWTIEYSTAIDGSSIADALTDLSLQTKIHGASGLISRRIKHFSGYNILSGGEYIPCDPADGNPLCVWVDDDGIGGGGH